MSNSHYSRGAGFAKWSVFFAFSFFCLLPIAADYHYPLTARDLACVALLAAVLGFIYLVIFETWRGRRDAAELRRLLEGKNNPE